MIDLAPIGDAIKFCGGCVLAAIGIRVAGTVLRWLIFAVILGRLLTPPPHKEGGKG